MNQQSMTPIIEKKWNIWRLVVLIGILVGIAASLVALYKFRHLVGLARAPRVSPTPLLAVASTLPELTAPYLRLTTTKTSFAVGETVPVDVWLHTGGQEVMAVNILMSYDSQILGVIEDNVRSTDTFKSIDIESAQDGQVKFSLFITPTVGHLPVKLTSETKIATVNFKALSAIENTKINLVLSEDDAERCSLTGYMLGRTEQLTNLLKDATGISLTISD